MYGEALLLSLWRRKSTTGRTTSRLGFGREADEARREFVPLGEEPVGAGAEGLFGVELDEAVDGFAGFGVTGLAGTRLKGLSNSTG